MAWAWGLELHHLCLMLENYLFQQILHVQCAMCNAIWAQRGSILSDVSREMWYCAHANDDMQYCDMQTDFDKQGIANESWTTVSQGIIKQARQMRYSYMSPKLSMTHCWIKEYEQECHGDWLAVQHGTVLAQDLQKKFEVKNLFVVSWYVLVKWNIWFNRSSCFMLIFSFIHFIWGDRNSQPCCGEQVTNVVT